MHRILISFCVALAVIPSAMALEVLHCADIDAIGYQWKNGKPNATRYVPLNFVVKIVSDTERVIDAPSPDYNSDTYECRHLKTPRGVLACARRGSLTGFPINFNNNNYERVGNLSAQIGGMPDLYVAYGRCMPF